MTARVSCLFLVLSAGCDFGSPIAMDGPAIVSTTPADGAESVDRGVDVRVIFDRALLPGSVNRGAIWLQSGNVRPSLSVRFDPVDNAVIARAFSGSALQPNVGYELRVEDIRDLSGRGLAEPFVAFFRTSELETEPEPLPEVGFDEVLPIFASRCATAGCHDAETRVLGLDLSSASGVEETAINVVAEQMRTGSLGDGATSGHHGLWGLRRVDAVGGAGRPETSYLIYKLLGDEHILGDVMPPTGEPPLEADEIRLIADWIRSGALIR